MRRRSGAAPIDDVEQLLDFDTFLLRSWKGADMQDMRWSVKEIGRRPGGKMRGWDSIAGCRD